MPKLRNKLTKVVVSVADDHPFASSRQWEKVTAPRGKRTSLKPSDPDSDTPESDKD